MSSAVDIAGFPQLIQWVCHDLEATQKPYRLLHIYGVIQTSLSLAAKNGVDAEQAALAAALHDCAKHVSREETLQLVDSGAIKLEPPDKEFPATWHGPVAAWMARSKYQVTDAEVLNAVENHTLGCRNPSKLLQILMCADSCEPGRTYRGVEELRQMVRNDLRLGYIAVLKAKVLDLSERGKSPHPRIFETIKSLEN